MELYFALNNNYEPEDIFSPIEEEVFENINSLSAFYRSIKVNHEGMPDYRGADIAIIGLTENRGTENNDGVAKGQVR